MGTSLALAADIMKYKAPKKALAMSTKAGIRGAASESCLPAYGSIIINPHPIIARITPSSSFWWGIYP